LYRILSNLELIDDLKWKLVNLSYQKFESLKIELEENFSEYEPSEKQKTDKSN
jgi:hypothetical protein